MEYISALIAAMSALPAFIDYFPIFMEKYPQTAWGITAVITIVIAKKAQNFACDLVVQIKKIGMAIFSITENGPGDIEKLTAAGSNANKEMKAIALEYGADRVGINLFHNGTASIHNVHFLKTSVAVEGLSGAVGPILPVSQNRLVAEYGNLGDRIILNKEIVRFSDIESMGPDLVGFSDFLKIHFVKSVHLIPLFGKKNGKVGVDGCLYIHHCTESQTLSEGQITEIQVRAQAVYNGLSSCNEGNCDV